MATKHKCPNCGTTNKSFNVLPGGYLEVYCSGCTYVFSGALSKAASKRILKVLNDAIDAELK